MAKAEIKRLIQESKGALERDHEAFEQSIKDDLESFKKKALG